ncbi:MAG: ribosome silencing factor [Treponema sp.]|jgi:ribosome-associated protein|nr:ribosome silencing factor [Treponema sp.]
MLQAVENAQSLASVLAEYHAENVQVIDVRENCTWTDFFVIATVTSATHLQGLERHIKEWCTEHNINIAHKSQRMSGESGSELWHVIDLGTVVVHLMSEYARSFYELERLWIIDSTG